MKRAGLSPVRALRVISPQSFMGWSHWRHGCPYRVTGSCRALRKPCLSQTTEHHDHVGEYRGGWRFHAANAWRRRHRRLAIFNSARFLPCGGNLETFE